MTKYSSISSNARRVQNNISNAYEKVIEMGGKVPAGTDYTAEDLPDYLNMVNTYTNDMLPIECTGLDLWLDGRSCTRPRGTQTVNNSLNGDFHNLVGTRLHFNYEDKTNNIPIQEYFYDDYHTRNNRKLINNDTRMLYTYYSAGYEFTYYPIPLACQLANIPFTVELLMGTVNSGTYTNYIDCYWTYGGNKDTTGDKGWKLGYTLNSNNSVQIKGMIKTTSNTELTSTSTITNINPTSYLIYSTFRYDPISTDYRLKTNIFKNGNTSIENTLNSTLKMKTARENKTNLYKYNVNHLVIHSSSTTTVTSSIFRLGLLRVWSRLLSDAELLECYKYAKSKFVGVV